MDNVAKQMMADADALEDAANFGYQRGFEAGLKAALDERAIAWKDQEADAFRRGQEDGRAEILAKVRALPSPVESFYGEHRCLWCGLTWGMKFDAAGAFYTATQHPANACLWALAHPVGKE